MGVFFRVTPGQLTNRRRLQAQFLGIDAIASNLASPHFGHLASAQSQFVQTLAVYHQSRLEAQLS